MDFTFNDLLIVVATCLISFFILKFCESRYYKSGNLSTLSISLINGIQECKEACSVLQNDCNKLGALGFDCEWVSEIKEGKSVQKPVSLLQLASIHGYCGLFQLSELGHIPPELQFILENDKLLKLGVNCCHDAKLIEKDYGVKVKGCLDLRHLYPTETSLASLAKNVIGVNLRKDAAVICTDWGTKILSMEQVDYAAKDAWVAIEIFKKWMTSVSRKNNIDKNINIERYVDIPFTIKQTMQKIKSTITIEENVRLKKPSQKFARKTPLYDNCWMYAPDGELLCSCDRKKAEWYIKKGLAISFCDDPFSIRLLFEPTTRPSNDSEGDFYRQFKQNCCVVCGSQESYMKHYVVPREYRKHFPASMKSHQSHDVVLTCAYCHSKAKMYMKRMKEELAHMCGAPTYISHSLKYKEYSRMTNICRTLLSSGNNIPKERQEYLKKTIQEFFMLPCVTNEVLKEISLGTGLVEEKITNHGEKVVQYFQEKERGLTELEELWRKCFLDNLKPQYLPSAWSIYHNHKKQHE